MAGFRFPRFDKWQGAPNNVLVVITKVFKVHAGWTFTKIFIERIGHCTQYTGLLFQLLGQAVQDFTALTSSRHNFHNFSAVLSSKFNSSFPSLSHFWHFAKCFSANQGTCWLAQVVQDWQSLHFYCFSPLNSRERQESYVISPSFPSESIIFQGRLFTPTTQLLRSPSEFHLSFLTMTKERWSTDAPLYGYFPFIS